MILLLRFSVLIYGERTGRGFLGAVADVRIGRAVYNLFIHSHFLTHVR